LSVYKWFVDNHVRGYSKQEAASHYLRLFLQTEHGTTVRIAAYENIEVIIYKNKKNRQPA